MPTVVLENRHLRVVLLPTIGARVFQLIYKSHDINLLWTHPRIQPSLLPFGARYDDVWCGGWDELFPNNEPAVINGELFPDHGEVWATEWEFETRATEEEVVADFGCVTRISDVRIRKTYTLRRDEPRLRVTYLLENKSGVSLPMLWNLHVAMAVSERHRLALPPMKVRLEPAFPGTINDAPLEFDWPAVDTPLGRLDLSRIPPASERRLHFFYGTQLSAGWWGLADTESGLACGLSFDPGVFRSCWLFGSFGGWRNLNVAVVEPSTGYPFNIDAALMNGTCPQLAPGQILTTSVVFSVAANITAIRSISPDGQIL